MAKKEKTTSIGFEGAIWRVEDFCRSKIKSFFKKGRRTLLVVLFCFCPIIINSTTYTKDTIPQSDQNQNITTAPEFINKENIVINSSEIVDYFLEKEKQESKNQNSGLTIYAPFLISILAIVFSFIATFISTRSSREVKMHDIKMRTANIIVAKRLEVFPKLHVLTDTLGAAIRYYNNHKKSAVANDNQIKILKKEINEFYKRLADWDAKYCIFGGDNVTKNISVIRHGLEEVDVWENSELTQDDINSLYSKLTCLEHALKEEMDIFFIENRTPRKT